MGILWEKYLEKKKRLQHRVATSRPVVTGSKVVEGITDVGKIIGDVTKVIPIKPIDPLDMVGYKKKKKD